MVVLERRQLSWQRGAAAAERLLQARQAQPQRPLGLATGRTMVPV